MQSAGVPTEQEIEMYGYYGYGFNGTDEDTVQKGCGPIFGQMMTNIVDRKGEYEVEVVVPGASKEDIGVTYADEFLQVSVAGKQNDADGEQEGKASYLWREFEKDGIERSIYVGGHIDEDGIRATYANGILTVRVPKEQKHAIRVD